MSEPLVKNLKNMLLIIGKAGCQQSDCPVPSKLYETMIMWLFDDVGNRSKITTEYASRRKQMEKAMNDDGLSLDEALASRDRTIFRYIDLFPSWVREKHGDKIEWFSSFLMSRATDRVVEYLCRYIEAMDINLSHI